jgi:hypothetical protein
VSAALAGVRAKLDRAGEHLQALDAATAEFFESKPYEIAGHFEPDTNQWIVTVKPFTDPPLRIGVILGDYLFNLRSALDHLVCQFALLDTGGAATCERTQFPICSSPTNFVNKQGTWLLGLSPGHVADIERLQPYHRGAQAGDHFLSILNEFNNVDKHRVVHPLFGYYRGPADILHVIGNRDAGVIDDTMSLRVRERRIEGETEIVRLRLWPIGTNPHVDVGGTLVFDPAFGESWLRGSALQEIGARVAGIVDGFAAEF